MKIKIYTDKTTDIKMFGRVIQKNGWEHSGRCAEENIFVYVIDGEANFELKEYKYKLKKNSIIILPKNEYYKAHTDTFCEYYFFHFDSYTELTDMTINDQTIYNAASYSYRLPNKEEFICPDVFYENSSEELRRILSECNKISYSITNTKKIYIISKFYEIMFRLCELSEQEKKRYPILLDEICEYIKKEYQNPLSLYDLSFEFNVSKSYIARIFKTHLNTTALKYITDFKLDYARELLINTNMSVSDISSHLGYDDSFYFSRIFKNKFTLSPKEFRKENT